jgi:hypothetical protein
MKITAKEIIDRINHALAMFGSYTYNDKGAREVMDINEIVECLKTMPAKEIIAVLQEVELKHKNPYPCLSDILGAMDDWESPVANELFESDIAQRNY